MHESKHALHDVAILTVEVDSKKAIVKVVQGESQPS